MRNELDDVFQQARAAGRGVLIPYLTAGYPEPDGFVELAASVLEAGADVLEIGIPFSDPLLDGPAIQRSQAQALLAGVTPADCLGFAAEIRRRAAKPVLFMGAYNPILSLGLERFCRESAEAGASGLIVPDLPYEEQDELRVLALRHNLHLIQMVAPTSTSERVRKVCRVASGFVYCISVAGVTGARGDVAATAAPLVERVRGCTEVPVAVGFGISGPESAARVAAFADGVIVGSALMTMLTEAGADEREGRVRELIGGLRRAIEPSAVG